MNGGLNLSKLKLNWVLTYDGNLENLESVIEWGLEDDVLWMKMSNGSTTVVQLSYIKCYNLTH